jgi:hypothetical protein
MEPLVLEAKKLVPEQEVASALLQVRVADCPEVIAVGSAVMKAMGALGVGVVTVTVAEAGSEVPPAPEHVIV